MSEEMCSCPYDKQHNNILRKNLQKHILKCRLTHPDIMLEKCPFNSMHVMPESEKRMHMASCPDRKIVEAYKYSLLANVKKEENDPPDVRYTGDSDEDDWEGDSTTKSYDPVKYVINNPIIRYSVGNLPSERKNFTEREEKRFAELKPSQEPTAKKVVIRQQKSILVEPKLEPESAEENFYIDRQPTIEPLNKRPKLKENLENSSKKSPESTNNLQLTNNKNINHFKLDIMHENHPRTSFKLSELNNIKKAILEEMDNINMLDSSKAQFLSATALDGILSIICRNESSRNWLVSIQTTIKSSFKIKLMEEIEIPRKYNCVFYLPPEDCLPHKILISRLKLQNANVDISKWEFIRSIRTPDGGDEHHIIIDDATKAYLDRNHFYLFLNLSQIFVEVMQSLPVVKIEPTK